MPRPADRKPDALRPLRFKRRYTRHAPGSVLVSMGHTVVLCTCSVEPKVPDFLVGKGKGWLTAEYGMLPGSTHGRKARDKGGQGEESFHRMGLILETPKCSVFSGKKRRRRS